MYTERLFSVHLSIDFQKIRLADYNSFITTGNTPVSDRRHYEVLGM